MKQMRTEYPRPQFEREEWQLLNGTWDFCFDRENIGLGQHWEQNFPSDEQAVKIEVPFVYQTALSGINRKEPIDIVWYKRSFTKEREMPITKIHFGAVDYETIVYLNGKQIGYHIGGHTPFSIDISNYCTTGENILVLRVFDPLEDEEILRGKQFWEKEPRGIWYTQTTGIWQSVWLEYLATNYLEDVKITPDVDLQKVDIDLYFSKKCIGCNYGITIEFEGATIIEAAGKIIHERMSTSFDVLQGKVFRGTQHGESYLWSPENPKLFDITFHVFDANEQYDRVASYFGMRKIHTKDGVVYLNNRPYYQRLVLDQGIGKRAYLLHQRMRHSYLILKLRKSLGLMVAANIKNSKTHVSSTGLISLVILFGERWQVLQHIAQNM
ncbi:hypothetical protein AwErysi_03080 [Erysipelotrichaceae bacterium]|nr:hypothetical protein AwErysi_03080 [Erysipelotrichaceae bacterium]